MKALTLTQPWATLVAIGAKRIETRGWGTPYRGPIAIHAAKGFPIEVASMCHTEPFRSVLNGAGIQRSDELPRGQVIATALLDTVWRFSGTTESEVRARSARRLLPAHEADFGDYASGRYGFVLSHVVPLLQPVDARGMLGLWSLPGDLDAAIAAELEAVVAR